MYLSDIDLTPFIILAIAIGVIVLWVEFECLVLLPNHLKSKVDRKGLFE